MTLTEARTIAAAYLREGVMRPEGFAAVILDGSTREAKSCWIFYYDSEEHRRTGDVIHALAGNEPIVVMKTDGSVHQSGSGTPLEEFLAKIGAL